MILAASHEILGDRDALVGRDSLDRHTGRDTSEQRKLDRARIHLGGKDLDRAALVVRALDVSLALEVGEVLMHRGERVIVELPRDLLEARRVAVLLRVAGEKIEYLALTLGKRHGVPLVHESSGHPARLTEKSPNRH